MRVMKPVNNILRLCAVLTLSGSVLRSTLAVVLLYRVYWRTNGAQRQIPSAGSVERSHPGPRYGGGSQKRGSPNTIQHQTVHERALVLLYVLLCSCTRWVGGWVGEWVGGWGVVRDAVVVPLLYCCTTVLLYMVDAGGWMGGSWPYPYYTIR